MGEEVQPEQGTEQQEAGNAASGDVTYEETQAETPAEAPADPEDGTAGAGDPLNEQGGPQGIQAETEPDGSQHVPSDPPPPTVEHPTREQREAAATAAYEAERAEDRRAQEEATEN